MAKRQHIQHFFKGSLWSGLATVARAASALVVNKLFAVYYGPSGITLLAHFQGLIAILTTLPNSGVNVGLIRFLAQEEVGSVRYRSFFWTGLWLNVLAFLGVLALVLAFPSFFLDRFGLETLFEQNGWFKVLCLVLFTLLLFHLFWMAVFLGRQALRQYVLMTFLTSFTTIAVLWWAVGRLELPVVLCLFLAGYVVSSLVGAMLVFSKGFVPKRGTLVTREATRELGKFLVMAVATLIGTKFSEFLIREIVITRFSLHDTGLWQAVVKLSDNYTLAYTSVLGMVYYPKIATLLPHETELKKYVRTIFFAVVPVLAAGLGLIYLLRRLLLVLLFNEDFLPAQYLLDFHLLGDFFKMTGWVLSYVVAVRAQVKLYIAVHLISPAVYFALVLGLIPVFGLQGLPIAYAIDWGLFLVFHLYLFRSYFTSASS